MKALVQDLRFGLRTLARSPGLVFSVMGLLSLGLGATTVIFSLVEATFLRPLPVRHPEQLVRMVLHAGNLPPFSEFPYVYYQALREHATTLAAVFGESKYYHFTLTDPAPPEEVTVYGVTPEYFEALGAPALYGRALYPSDATDVPGLPPAVLSYGFWQRRFGGDPGVVNGRSVFLNGHRFAVVGVMPRGFNGFTVDSSPDLRVPLRTYLLLANHTYDHTNLDLAGRLRPGFTRWQAEAECRGIYQNVMKDYLRNVRKLPPRTVAELLNRGMWLDPLERGVSVVRDRFGDVLKLLLASVGLLALIVCTNVGGLMLARAATREQEVAVRLAVGATRLRLVRQVLAENFLLAVPSALGGMLFALAALPLTVRMIPPIRDVATALIPLSVDARINWRIFVFLQALSLLMTLVFSLSPAIAVSRVSLDGLLRASRSVPGWRGRQFLIIVQIALCTFLLVLATLFVRTFQELRRTNSGFDSTHIATFTINVAGKAGGPAMLKTFSERVRELPGVVSVGSSSIGIMREHGTSTTVAREGETITRADFLNSNLNYVSPEYFETLGMHILTGRNLTPGDAPEPKRVGPTMTVVNQAFVERFFPQIDPVGKRFGYAPGMVGVADGRFEIVGVVTDAKYRSLREAIKPMVYTLESSDDQLVLYVRTRMRPEAIIEPVRKVLATIDPTVPFLEVHTLAEEIDDTMAGERLTATLASLFGVIAALLAGAGIYGLLAYVVTERRREIGIRMALGAGPAQIRDLIARQTLMMTAAGITLGLAGALIAGPGIRALLYGISPHDPKSLTATVAFVILTAVVATVQPAMRAAKVDPMVALRDE